MRRRKKKRKKKRGKGKKEKRGKGKKREKEKKGKKGKRKKRKKGRKKERKKRNAKMGESLTVKLQAKSVTIGQMPLKPCERKKRSNETRHMAWVHLGIIVPPPSAAGEPRSWVCE